LILFVVACFALPTYSHAAGAIAGNIIKEPLWKLLRDDAGLHTFWNDMMKLVNSFVVLLLIVVAFCEILNINISTYGVKKILPSLVFAVLAANFSWIMCRLFIDWANIAMSRFSDTTSIIDPLINSRTSFNIDLRETSEQVSGAVILGDNAGTISFFQAGMKTLFVWAGAIALYILAFLLLLRNAIIIALAVFSPIAFMAMVLPQTKSAFNKWWTTFMQWTFMPTVSVFMLWMGSKVQDSLGSNTDPLIGFLIAIGFIYGAVKVPFSMSGAASGIMNKWADMGKKTASFAGKAAYTVSGAKGGVETLKTNVSTAGIKIATKFKDKTGIGSGLDIAKKNQEIAQRGAKAVTDKKVGAHIKRNKEKYGIEEERIASDEGSTESAMKAAKASVTAEGSRYYNETKGLAIGGAEAKKNSEKFDNTSAAFKDEMLVEYMGSLENSAAGKKQKAELMAAMGDKQKFSAMAEKAGTTELLDGAMVEQIQIDNIKTTEEEAKKYSDAVAEYLKHVATVTAGNIGSMNADEQKSFRDATVKLAEKGFAVSNIEKFSTMSVADKIAMTAENINISGQQADINKAYTDAQNEVVSLAAELQSRMTITSAEEIPAYLRHMITYDTNTNKLVLNQFKTKLERTRASKYMSGRVDEGATTATSMYTADEISSILTNGGQGITKKMLDQYYNNQKSKNTAADNQKITEFLKASQRMASNSQNANAQKITSGMLSSLAANGQGGLDGLHEMADSYNKTIEETYKGDAALIAKFRINKTNDAKLMQKMLNDANTGRHGSPSTSAEAIAVRKAFQGAFQGNKKLSFTGTSSSHIGGD